MLTGIMKFSFRRLEVSFSFQDLLKEYLEGEEAAAIMFTFADQVDAIKEALQMEYEEGETRGKAIGAIKETIRIYRDELNLSPIEILGRIRERKRCCKAQKRRRNK